MCGALEAGATYVVGVTANRWTSPEKVILATKAAQIIGNAAVGYTPVSYTHLLFQDRHERFPIPMTRVIESKQLRMVEQLTHLIMMDMAIRQQ